MRKILLAVLMFFAPGAALAAVDSFYLEDLTWPEVRDRMQKGTDTIIIPTGGTEQNGPGIAIGKHNWIVHYTSGEIARTLGNALAAPVIAYVPEGTINPPQGHMLFPGTISLREEGFAMVLEDAARSFKQEGFKRICFIGDSGGNQGTQKQVAQKLSKEWEKEGVFVLQISDYYAHNGQAEWIKAQKLKISQPAAHAGFMDASEVMATRGASGVRPELLKAYGATDFEATGVMGDASAATAEAGKTLIALKIKAAVEQIKRARELTTPVPASLPVPAQQQQPVRP